LEIRKTTLEKNKKDMFVFYNSSPGMCGKLKEINGVTWITVICNSKLNSGTK